MPIINNNDNLNVIVTEQISKIVLNTPGPQGPRGRTILNGNGVPAENLGLEGDFYYDKTTTKFYGPKLSDVSWSGSTSYILNGNFSYFWELAQVSGPINGIYSVSIRHNLGFRPNVTVKSSAGDVLETGIDYNDNDTLTLTMAQPFSGAAYLS